MTFYLACLKEFAEFANARDRAANVSPEKCFKLPYKLAIHNPLFLFSISQSRLLSINGSLDTEVSNNEGFERF